MSQESREIGGGLKKALVVGIDQYKSLPRLDLAVVDAEKVAETLKRANFQVEPVQTNLNNQEIKNALLKFGKKLNKGDVALFYFAGQGGEQGTINGTINYLFGLDGKVDEDEQGNKIVDGIELKGHVIQYLTLDQQECYFLILIDACRSNPKCQQKIRDSTGQFGENFRGVMHLPSHIGINEYDLVFACQPGGEALEPLCNPKKPAYFAQALCSCILEGSSWSEVVTNVKARVGDLSQGRQSPQNTSNLKATIYLQPQEKYYKSVRIVTYDGKTIEKSTQTTNQSIDVDSQGISVQNLWNQNHLDIADFRSILLIFIILMSQFSVQNKYWVIFGYLILFGSFCIQMRRVYFQRILIVRLFWGFFALLACYCCWKYIKDDSSHTSRGQDIQILQQNLTFVTTKFNESLCSDQNFLLNQSVEKQFHTEQANVDQQQQVFEPAESSCYTQVMQQNLTSVTSKFNKSLYNDQNFLYNQSVEKQFHTEQANVDPHVFGTSIYTFEPVNHISTGSNVVFEPVESANYTTNYIIIIWQQYQLVLVFTPLRTVHCAFNFLSMRNFLQMTDDFGFSWIRVGISLISLTFILALHGLFLLLIFVIIFDWLKTSETDQKRSLIFSIVLVLLRYCLVILNHYLTYYFPYLAVFLICSITLPLFVTWLKRFLKSEKMKTNYPVDDFDTHCDEVANFLQWLVFQMGIYDLLMQSNEGYRFFWIQPVQVTASIFQFFYFFQWVGLQYQAKEYFIFISTLLIQFSVIICNYYLPYYFPYLAVFLVNGVFSLGGIGELQSVLLSLKNKNKSIITKSSPELIKILLLFISFCIGIYSFICGLVLAWRFVRS